MPRGHLSSYSEQLTDQFRRRILTHQLAPGQRLREVPIAKEFGVSRGPIRDCFAQLTREGLLVARPNAGVQVAEPPSAFKRRTLVALRRTVEADALKEAMRMDRDALLGLLEGNLARYETACGEEDFESVVSIDMAFHRLLVESADGGSLLGVWLPVISQMFLRYGRLESLMDSFQEHAGIVGAVRGGNVREATRKLKEHIV